MSLGASERVDYRCVSTGTTYTLNGLLPGTYRLNIFPPTGFQAEWYSDATSYATATDIVVTAGAATTANVTLDPLGSSITGQVQDSSGNPLSGVAVSVSGVFSPATTDALGNFRVSGLADGDGYRVTFSKDGYVSEYYEDARFGDEASSVTIAGADVSLGVIQLATATAIVSGQVTETGSPGVVAAPVCVTFTEVSGLHFGLAYRRCTSTGSYAVALPVGEFQVEVAGQTSPTRYLSEIAFAQSTPYSAVLGAQTLDLDIAAGGQISGRLVQEGTSTGIPGVYAIVRSVPTAWTTLYNLSGSGGLFVTDGLADGDYSVQFVNFGGRFISQYLGGSLTAPGTLVTIADGNDVVLPDVELSLGAVVTGVITNATTGLPTSGCVNAYISGTFDLVAWLCGT